LENISKFWGRDGIFGSRKQLQEWQAAIRRGETPKLDRFTIMAGPVGAMAYWLGGIQNLIFISFCVWLAFIYRSRRNKRLNT